MVHWKMLERNAMVNKELYIAQLHFVNEAIRLKRPHRQGQTILHDNARFHVTQVVKVSLQELEWEVLQHPPYSPDLAPTDYYLFCSLSNHMRGVTFDNEEDLKNWLNKILRYQIRRFLAKRHRQIGRKVGGGRKQQRRIHNLLIYNHKFLFLFKIKIFDKNATNIFLDLILFSN